MDVSTKLKVAVNTVLRKFGYEISKFPGEAAGSCDYSDIDEEVLALWEKVRPYTMTCPERIFSLHTAIKHIVDAGVPGAVVECGVWKGGCAMAMALSLMRSGDRARHLYLYDTYDEGWPAGQAEDVRRDGVHAHTLWEEAVARGETPDTLFAHIAAVHEAMKSTGYPMEKVHLIKGKVEDTIPAEAPDQIALLRLDTDWYESTRHEFLHLWPRLVAGGVIIIDDYGLWQGSRKATDEYFAANNIHVLLHRIDATGCRIGVKRD